MKCQKRKKERKEKELKRENKLSPSSSKSNSSIIACNCSSVISSPNSFATYFIK